MVCNIIWLSAIPQNPSGLAQPMANTKSSFLMQFSVELFQSKASEIKRLLSTALFGPCPICSVNTAQFHTAVLLFTEFYNLYHMS